LSEASDCVKKDIRNRILLIRDTIPLDMRGQKDLRIRETVFSLPEFISAKTFLSYASFRSEVETIGLMKDSLSIGKKVLLPKVNREKSLLDLYEIKSIDELSPGYMGIPEPHHLKRRRAVVDDSDLIIVPGAAFDRKGNRLGYGAGYYDNLLSARHRTMPIVALAYDEQLVDAIPAEEHDVRVTVIVTDRGVIRTS